MKTRFCLFLLMLSPLFVPADVAIMAKKHTTHKEFDVPVVGPSPLSRVTELPPDGVGEGNLTIAIPTLDLDLGTWRVSRAGVDNPVFFVAQ
jgi:hypothetical protein